MTETTYKFRMPPESWSMCLADDSKADWFMSAYETPITRKDVEFSRGDSVEAADYQASGDPFWDSEETRWARPYNVVRAADGTGVLVISIQGSLVAGVPYQLGAWLTGYEYITAAVRRGAADSTVKSIVLDINSPGGMVRGCAECGDAIAAAAKVKRVLAYASDTAASAAYWLASQANEVHVSRTGEVGSIGVITGHYDESESLKAWGYKFTAIYAGKCKVDGHPYLELTDEAKARIQERINAIYGEFISAVARGRGMNGNDIRNTEAAVFAAHKSVRIGLADRVSTRAEVMETAFGAKLEDQAVDDTNDKEPEMDPNDTTDAKTDAPEVQAEVTTTKEDAPAPAPTATDTDVSKAAAAAAVSRIREIQGCDEAKGREALANTFAFDTELSVGEVKKLLAAAPVAVPEAAAPDRDIFSTWMANTPNPDVGAGEQSDQDSDVLAAYRAAQV